MALHRLLGEILTGNKLLTVQQLSQALEYQRKIVETSPANVQSPTNKQRARLISEARMASKEIPFLGKILVDLGFITAQQVAAALKEQEKVIEEYQILDGQDLGVAIEMASIVNSTLNLSEVLALIMKQVNRVTDSTASTLMLLDERTRELVFSVPTGPKAELLTDVRLPPGKGIAGWVAEHEQPVIVSNVREDPRFYGEIDKTSGFQTKTVLCVPLKAKAKLIGVLEVINKSDGTSFKEKDKLLLMVFAYHAAMAIGNARLYRELNDRMREEREMQKKLAEAEKLRALGQMAAGVAHYFNNMLAVVLGNSELIEMEIKHPTLLRKVKAIEGAALRCANTVKRLLKFTKFENGGASELVRINDIVRDAVELSAPKWKDQLQKKGIDIDVAEDLAKEPLTIFGSSSDLREMVVNLIFNSVDAMPKGGRIFIKTFSEGEKACLAISDTGDGMTSEVQRKAFEPFFTTRGLDHSGLGMSMAYTTIRNHGGEIEVSTAPGEGTIFILKFFNVARPVEHACAAISPEEAENARIIIVDDVPQVGEMLSAMLEELGYRADVFDNAKSALQAMENHGYRMLITDLGMPDMTGWDVAKVARQSNPAMHIGMMTGWDVTETEARTKGVDFVVRKPFRLDQIKTAIAEIV